MIDQQEAHEQGIVAALTGAERHLDYLDRTWWLSKDAAEHVRLLLEYLDAAKADAEAWLVATGKGEG